MEYDNVNVLFKPRYDLSRDLFEIQVTLEDGRELHFTRNVSFCIAGKVFVPIEDHYAGSPCLCRMVQPPAQEAADGDI